MEVFCSERQKRLELHGGCTAIEHKQRNAFVFTALYAVVVELARFGAGLKRNI